MQISIFLYLYRAPSPKVSFSQEPDLGTDHTPLYCRNRITKVSHRHPKDDLPAVHHIHEPAGVDQ